MACLSSLPSRREALRAGAGSAALLGAPWISRLSRSKKERPNLLLVCSDQQHWRALGHVEIEMHRTPGHSSDAFVAFCDELEHIVTATDSLESLEYVAAEG